MLEDCRNDDNDGLTFASCLYLFMVPFLSVDERQHGSIFDRVKMVAIAVAGLLDRFGCGVDERQRTASTTTTERMLHSLAGFFYIFAILTVATHPIVILRMPFTYLA